MAQTGSSVAKFYLKQSHRAGLALLLVLQKALYIVLGVMLLPLLIALSASTPLAFAQAVATTASSSVPEYPELPDAPSASATAPQASRPPNSFPLPRFGQPLQPMDAGDKFKYFVQPAFGPRAVFTAALRTGIRMANPPRGYPHEWHSGAEAYGRLYGDSFARNGAGSLGRFSASILLHEDPRYRRSKSTFVPIRLVHALAFTFIDRTDGGHPTPAIANFTGAAANGFIGNTYLPAGFDNLTHAGQRSAIAFGGMASQNVMQEFAPDLARLLMKVHPPHIPMPPVWWTGDK